VKVKLKCFFILFVTLVVLVSPISLSSSPLSTNAKSNGKSKTTFVIPQESTYFSTVSVEEAATYNTASDGDLWPTAWSDDGYLYSVNGDGKGFDLNAPWSDIVVNKITGHPATNDVAGIRLAAGDEVGQVWNDPSEYNRKPTGLISVEGDLYLAVQDLNKGGGWRAFNDAPSATILKSTDKGKTWTWDHTKPMFDNHVFTTIMFLDYGKDSENNIFDEYVYAYGLDNNWRDSFIDSVPDPTKLYLARVPKDRIQDRSAWEFFVGDLDGNEKWSKHIKHREPVLQDDRRVYSDTLFPISPDNMSVLSQGSVVYNKPLDRYIYTSWTEFTFEFYEAPTPWGPWKRFLSKDFGIYPWFDNKNGGYGVVIPSKFISEDGTEMWMNANTFVGGIQKYNFSLRKMYVTPYEETIPVNEKNNKNLASPEFSENVTPISKYSAHYGNLHFLNDGIKLQTEDNWNGVNKHVDWWGYTWSHSYNMNEVEYTTGNMFGPDGGWFNDIKVQVRQNFEWVDVENLKGVPTYPNDSSAGTNQTYTFTFDATWGDGVRIFGTPGGTATFTSVAELEVYYR
jgi:hypothetical protein